MPYIKQEDRKNWENVISEISEIAFCPHELKLFFNKGNLSYLIIKLCLMYIELKEKSYDSLVDVIGVLECTKAEFIRREVNPYEDEKIKENDDVFSN